MRYFSLNAVAVGSIFNHFFCNTSAQGRRIVVSFDPMNRRMEDVECIYVIDFLKMLWGGEI